MSQIRKKSMFCSLVIAVSLAALSACASPNGQFDPDTGKHPADWVPLGHVAAFQAGTMGCIDCHGSDYAGGVSRVPCSECHQNGSPAAQTGCGSCHDKPPAGIAFPNTKGAHVKHNALGGVTDVCDTCHSSAGSGTKNHFNGTVDVQFMNIYDSKGGTATYNADGTCSNVRCHGGKKTPAWSNGTIPLDSLCFLYCHTLGTAPGIPEYNSYYSGAHPYMTFILTCTSCHDADKLADNHFRNLNTPAMEGPASETILPSLTYVPSGTPGIGVFMNPEACSSCHNFPINWQ